MRLLQRGGLAGYVENGNDAAFASAIQSLLDDREERQKRSDLARACAELYTPERMARRMADIYARLTSEQVPPIRLAGAA